jgi:hypothetical protein
MSDVYEYYIMRSGDMQAIRNLVHLVHNTHLDLDLDLDLMYNTRRDPRNRCCMYSRDRSRRT